MGNELDPVLDGATRLLALLLSDIESVDLPSHPDAIRDLCTTAPEGARWLSTQIERELARTDTTPADRASDHVLPRTLKRPRDSDRPYQPSKRVHMTEEPLQTPADGPRDHDGPSFEQDSQVGQRQTIKRLRSENITLLGHRHEALEQVKELQHCARVEPIYTSALSYENFILKTQLLDIATAREGSGKIEKGSLGPSEWNVSFKLELIEDSITDACLSILWSSPRSGRELGQPKKTTNPMLSKLASTLCGLNFESLVAHCKEYRITEDQVLRSLVATALWALVWRHPPEETVAEESPILRHYKKQVSALYGPEALHRVELLAYDSLVSEPHFDADFVAGHAKSLTDYMCDILEPLLLDSEPYNEPGTSGSKPPDFFESVMTSAIRLAVKLYLTDRHYIWRFIQPGSNFDPKTMKIGPYRTSQVSGGDVEKVQLCISPAVYRSKTLGGRASPHGNQGTAMSASDDLSDYKLVAKGLVLVRGLQGEKEEDGGR